MNRGPDAPAVDQFVSELRSLYARYGDENRGRIILARAKHAGTAHDLRAKLTSTFKKARPRALVFSGDFDQYGRYNPEGQPRSLPTALDAASVIADAGQLAVGIAWGSAAAAMYQQIRGGLEHTLRLAFDLSSANQSRAPTYLKDQLRKAAVNQPVVYVVGRVDLAQGRWWGEWLLDFAPQIYVDVRLWIVMTTTIEVLPDEVEELHRSGKCESRMIAPPDVTAFAGWLGGAKSAGVDHLWDTTAGDPDLALRLVRRWQEAKVLKRDTKGRWVLDAPEDSATLGLYHDLLSDKVRTLTPQSQRSTLWAFGRYLKLPRWRELPLQAKPSPRHLRSTPLR